MSEVEVEIFVCGKALSQTSQAERLGYLASYINLSGVNESMLSGILTGTELNLRKVVLTTVVDD